MFMENSFGVNHNLLKNVIKMDSNTTTLLYDTGSHEFTFDYSFWSADSINESKEYASQEQIYEQVGQPLLERSFEGYNTCLFAYGQVCLF